MAFEETQNKLNELRNLTWQNGKLIEQIEKLTKMLEEKEDSALVVEINEAKRVLADAINTKGGYSTPDESFQQLASDIQTLPYARISAEGIVQTEEFSFLSCWLGGKNSTITEINDYNTTQITASSKDFGHFSVLRKITFHNVTSIQKESLLSNTNVLYLIAPKCNIWGGGSYYDALRICTSIMWIELGVLLSVSGFAQENKLPNLRNITIGEGTDINLSFHYWQAANVIAEGQSGIDELNSNLRTNLLEKLYDHSQDGETRTLRLGWLAYVSQENIDYANSKGWTLTT